MYAAYVSLGLLLHIGMRLYLPLVAYSSKMRIRESFLGLEPRRKRSYSMCYNIGFGYFQHLYILLHWGDPFGTGNGNAC